MADTLPAGEPIYVIPPNEQQPEVSVRADFLTEERDWGHQNLGLEVIHAAGHLGEGVLVAVCDTGVDPDHQDLAANLESGKCCDFTGAGTWRDGHGHGTHCAGIVAATQGRDIGIVGAAPKARLCAMKVLNDSGSGASSWIAAGIRKAVDVGADIISLSLGGPSPDQQTRDAIRYAVGKGCWVVCAAGNDGGPAVSYPGHYPESIAVAATDPQDRRASFSTVNDENDVSAPGVSILSTLPQNRYGRMSGTSMATPYVAGGLALLRGAVKRAGGTMPTQTQVLADLAATCKDLGPVGRDAGYGWGLLGVLNLIERYAPTPKPPKPPVSPPVPPVVAGWTGTIRVVNGLVQSVTPADALSACRAGQTFGMGGRPC